MKKQLYSFVFLCDLCVFVVKITMIYSFMYTTQNIEVSTFLLFLQFIESKTGMHVPDTNYRTVESAILERANILNKSPISYFYIISNDTDECEIFLNMVTINETYFFREEKHFNILKEYVFPNLCKNNSKITLWSSACSTGEEAISLALISEEFLYSGNNVNYQIFATDINTSSLAVLAKGTYSQNSFRKDGQPYHYLFEKYGTYNKSQWSINDNIKNKIQPMYLNLYSDKFENLLNVHIAFLRNVLIYMEADFSKKILKKVIEKILPDGYLFLGSAEVHKADTADLELIQIDGTYFFQKKKSKNQIAGLQSKPVMTDNKIETISTSKSKITTKNEPLSSNQKNTVKIYDDKKKDSKAIESNIEKSGKEKPSLDEILKIANQKSWAKERIDLSTYKYKATSINEKLADLFLDAVHSVNSNDFDKATNDLKEIEKLIQPNEINYYLIGFIEMQEGEYNKAIENFRKSISYNKDFWPARFFLGQLLRSVRPDEACKEFSICTDIINKTSLEKKQLYHFLLEDFHEQYFIDMCMKWIDKLSGK